MAELKFRDLRSDEIDCRVATISEKGLSLLLYKDARCDMNILDETVGAFNWQRSHSRDNANCVVSLWDESKTQWISKEDTGTESNTEAAKGLASDSFKRACFNWGIGRELYTAPFIWVGSDKCEIKEKNGKKVCYQKFSVYEITIKDKKITSLQIINEATGVIVYTFGKNPTKKATTTGTKKPTTSTPNRDLFRKFVGDNKLSDAVVGKIIADCGIKQDSTDEEWAYALVYAKSILLAEE